MVRLENERRRLRERVVGGEEPWVDVSVRADQGQLARFVVDLPGDSTDGGIGIEEPIRVEGQPRKRWGHPRDNIL